MILLEEVIEFCRNLNDNQKAQDIANNLKLFSSEFKIKEESNEKTFRSLEKQVADFKQKYEYWKKKSMEIKSKMPLGGSLKIKNPNSIQKINEKEEGDSFNKTSQIFILKEVKQEKESKNSKILETQLHIKGIDNENKQLKEELISLYHQIKLLQESRKQLQNQFQNTENQYKSEIEKIRKEKDLEIDILKTKLMENIEKESNQKKESDIQINEFKSKLKKSLQDIKIFHVEV